jgi:autotransporter-associated beta strand protein
VWSAARLPFGSGKGNVNVNNNGLEVSTLAFWAAGTHNINGLNGNGAVVQVGSTNADLLTLQVGNGDADGNFSGVVQIRGDLVAAPEGRRFSFAKTGTGTQVLSGNNLYNGTTTVSGGTLLVNGTHASANPLNPDATPGAYTVLPTGSGPAILGGTGTISSTVNLSGVSASVRGTIAPGASAGTLTIGGLTLADHASFAFELDPSLAGPSNIGSGDNDLLDVTGNVDLSGADASTIELNVQDVGGGDFGGLGTWYLVKFDASDFNPGSFDLADIGITGLVTGYTATLGLAAEGGSDYLTLTVVPEPNAIILAGLGLVGLGFGLKRKQK